VAMVAEGSGLSNEDHRPSCQQHSTTLLITSPPGPSYLTLGAARSPGQQWTSMAPEHPTLNTVQRAARWVRGAHSSRSSPLT
jgi:hypothetical protein